MPVGGTVGWRRIGSLIRDDHPDAWALYGTLVLCRPELAVHSARGALVSAALGEPMGVHVDAACLWGWLLHDVGNLEIPARMLNHPGPLDDEQHRVVATHPVLGAELVGRIEGLRESAAIVACHHEYWDGEGYPRGLSGHDIPVPARVLAVGDAYAALTSLRPYRRAYSAEEAIDVIDTYAGTQFDPQIAEALPDVVAELPEPLRTPPVGVLPAEVDRRLVEHVRRAATLSPAQLEALYASGLGIDASEAARRLDRATGTQRTWSASLRRALACPPRVPLRRFLRAVGREMFRSLVPGASTRTDLLATGS